ncbi:hypothetical protein [Streptomyces sp. NPDC003943]
MVAEVLRHVVDGGEQRGHPALGGGARLHLTTDIAAPERHRAALPEPDRQRSRRARVAAPASTEHPGSRTAMPRIRSVGTGPGRRRAARLEAPG